MPQLITMANPFYLHQDHDQQINTTKKTIQKFLKTSQLIIGLFSLFLFYFGSEDSGEKILFVLFGTVITLPIFTLFGFVKYNEKKTIYLNYFSSFLLLIMGVLSIMSWIYSEKNGINRLVCPGENIILKLIAGILLIINSVIYFIESTYLTIIY